MKGKIDFVQNDRSIILIDQKDLARPTNFVSLDDNAGVVELVDIPDLGSGASRHGGSSPSARTKKPFRGLFRFYMFDFQ